MELLKIKKLKENAKVPSRGTQGSAGLDLCACIDEPITLNGGDTALIPTGIAIALPSADYGAFVFPRSGIAVKHGIGLLNSVGVIDSDYRGEIIVALHNDSEETRIVTHGDRIAQIIFQYSDRPIDGFEEVETLSETIRGEGGFGSTSKN